MLICMHGIKAKGAWILDSMKVKEVSSKALAICHQGGCLLKSCPADTIPTLLLHKWYLLDEYGSGSLLDVCCA